jgi:hypothetical protein
MYSGVPGLRLVPEGFVRPGVVSSWQDLRSSSTVAQLILIGEGNRIAGVDRVDT